MVASYDRLTDELQRSRIRLSDELIFSPQRYGDETFFHIEIPSLSKFFRIGWHEYVFISLFDGQTSFAAALAVTSQKLGPAALSQEQATRIVHWLLENGLASFPGHAAIVDAQRNPATKPMWFQKLNPFWLKVPLGNPNPVLEAIAPYVGWLFHPVAILVSILLMACALVTAVSHADQMVASEQILAPGNWLWMIATWVVLKTVHELGHALMCRRFGGTVRETGIIFVLLAPLAYVDVTSSWRMPSRWRRIAIAAAGMHIELLIASVCVFAWFATSSEVIRQQLANIICMAGISTVLFNANPLMRFDGYFILSDLMRIPNLYAAGTQSFQNQLSWLFYGQRPDESLCEIKNHRRLIAVYGFCSAMWKVLICAALAIAASVMFGGLGILLAAFGVFSWLARPMAAMGREFVRQKSCKPHAAMRAVLVASGIASVAICSWFWIPNPVSSCSPCLVDYEDVSRVRTRSTGFVEEVFVCEGQFVEAGAALLQLSNTELNVQVAELKSQLATEQTRERIALDQHEPGDAQIAARNQRAAAEMLDTKQRELDQLLVTAPIAGRIVGRNLRQLVGKHMRLGENVMTIGNESSKEIVLSIAPGDVDSSVGLVGQSVPIEIGSRRRFVATIQRVEPRASTRVTNPSLIVPHGGPLAVKVNEPSDATEEDRFELTDSRFHAIASIDAELSELLFAGERGWAKLDSSSNTIGRWLYSTARDWINDQLRQAAL